MFLRAAIFRAAIFKARLFGEQLDVGEPGSGWLGAKTWRSGFLAAMCLARNPDGGGEEPGAGSDWIIRRRRRRMRGR